MDRGIKLVVCIHCEYEWKTTSKLRLVTCPSCGKKTPIKSIGREGGRRSMSFSSKLVWTEEDYRKWEETVANLAKEMSEEFRMFYEPDPLMPIRVKPATEMIIEEELNYNGSLMQFRVRFPMPCIGLVKARPLLNGVQLPSEILGVNFKRGDKAQVELKNIDKYAHTIYLRFFSKKATEAEG